MLFGNAKRIFSRRKEKEGKQPEKTTRAPSTKTALVQVHEKSSAAPEWAQTLTSSLNENCLAPADEIILHAYELYCDDLNAPFHKRQRKMSGIYSDIAAGVAQLQSIAPDLVERAMARHRIEFDHFIDKKGGR